MELFRLPRDFDFMMYVNCLLLFMIAFFIMTFNNGETTIQYINNLAPMLNQEVNLSILNNNLTYIPVNNDINNLGALMKYKSDTIRQDFRLPYIWLSIYWLIIPIFNICYGIYCFKKGLLRGTKQYKLR